MRLEIFHVAPAFDLEQAPAARRTGPPRLDRQVPAPRQPHGRLTSTADFAVANSGGRVHDGSCLFQ